jgi:hypothetical protein
LHAVVPRYCDGSGKTRKTPKHYPDSQVKILQHLLQAKNFCIKNKIKLVTQPQQLAVLANKSNLLKEWINQPNVA